MKDLSLAALCLVLAASAAEAASGALSCFERRPEPDSVRALRLTAQDAAAGRKTVLILRLYGRRDAQGLGQLYVGIEEPKSMRGTSLLVLQRKDHDSAIYLASPEQPTPRPIQGPERADRMFGTDFSYEDLERVQHGWRPGTAEIVELPPTNVGDRPAYVVEVRPRDSVWQRVVYSLDQQSCLPLLIRFYEPGKTMPRKELTTDWHSHVEHGELWVVHSALMRDRETATVTHLMVDSPAQESLLPDDQFTVEGLERAVRGGVVPPPR